jgi:hypothetical protein
MRLVWIALVVACTPAKPDAPAPQPEDPGPAMEPLDPQPPRAVEPEPPPLPEAPLTVVSNQSWLGYHAFFDIRTVEQSWGPPMVFTEGVMQVQALGRTLERCSESDNEHGHTVWCPDAGLVSWNRHEGSWVLESRAIAVRRGNITWAQNACGALYLLGDDARASLCAHRSRTYGSDPRLRGEGCAWRITRDGPNVDHDPAASFRIDRDRAALEEWAHASEDQSLVEQGTRRIWIARGSTWTAAVEIDREACGDADGSSVAARLLELAPP